MIYLALLTIAFSLLRFGVLLANLLTRPWLRNQEHLMQGKMSILIPARDEENNIRQILGDIKACEPPELIHEVLVYDDQSTDGTAEQVLALARHDTRIRLISGEALPEGWKGKNHACNQLAKQASGDWYMFLDADVRLMPATLAQAVAFAEEKRLALLSVFPWQIMKSWGEWLVVPVMNWILLTLLPLRLVRTCKWTSFSGANGQFMLFNAAAYKRYQWHEAVKDEAVEDIKISKLIKRKKLKTATLIGRGEVTCRMYPDYPEAINGFTKNFGQFFSNSTPWMIIFGLLTSLGVILIPIFLNWMIVLSYLALLMIMRLIFAIVTKQIFLKLLLLSIPHQLITLKLMLKTFQKNQGKEITWKGRKV